MSLLPMAELYKPGRVIEDRKTKFAKLLAFVTDRGGWITSIPGAAEVMDRDIARVRAAPMSCGPLDTISRRDGEGRRILATAITEHLVLSSSSALVPPTPESTKAVAEVRRHAGICQVLRYTFTLE